MSLVGVKKKGGQGARARRKAERAKRAIERVATERQEAWGRVGEPVGFATQRLTTELEELFEARRCDDAEHRTVRS